MNGVTVVPVNPDLQREPSSRYCLFLDLKHTAVGGLFSERLDTRVLCNFSIFKITQILSTCY